MPSPFHRQRDAQSPARPGERAQEHVISEVEGHGRLIGRMLLELRLQAIRVLQHVRQALLAKMPMTARQVSHDSTTVRSRILR